MPKRPSAPLREWAAGQRQGAITSWQEVEAACGWAGQVTGGQSRLGQEFVAFRAYDVPGVALWHVWHDGGLGVQVGGDPHGPAVRRQWNCGENKNENEQLALFPL